MSPLDPKRKSAAVWSNDVLIRLVRRHVVLLTGKLARRSVQVPAIPQTSYCLKEEHSGLMHSW